MTPNEIPEEIRKMLDNDAGKVHSDEGRVLRSLARILERHREMIIEEIFKKVYDDPSTD